MNHMQDDNSIRMLNTRAASELLNVSVNTLRRWGDVGKSDYWRISPRGDRRFRREDIERLAWGLFQNSKA
jgi:excisionase family DNA binding protein